MDDAILVALVCPLFWALSNILDKLAVDHAIKTPEQFMFLLSQFYSLVFLGYLIGTSGSFALSPLAVLAGVLLFVLYYLYAVVLAEEDVSSVIAVHQAEPLFVMILAAALYQRLPTGPELIGFALILGGIFWFTSARSGAGPVLPLIGRRSAGLLTLSALAGAFATLISDVALMELSVLDIAGQSALGYGLAGLITLGHPRYRRAAFDPGRIGMFRKAGLIAATGLLDVAGYLAFYLALSLSDKPALVSVLSSIHPIYVFVISAVLATAFPTVMREDNSGRRLRSKAIGCVIVVIGILLLA